MISNIMIIDRDRIEETIAVDFGRKLIHKMDFIAIDNRDGTVLIIKNRFSGHTGVVFYEVVDTILDREE